MMSDEEIKNVFRQLGLVEQADRDKFNCLEWARRQNIPGVIISMPDTANMELQDEYTRFQD